MRSMDYWTGWYNSDTPDTGLGDDETVASIETKFGRICQNGYKILNAQCKDVVSGTYFSGLMPSGNISLRQPCTARGVECVNSQQTHGGSCHDIAIRFYCQYESDNSDRSSSIFPDFDQRIYIFLAIVPIAIFLVRILWACFFRRRRTQRRLQQRAARLAERSYSLSSSLSEDDNYSVNPELFNPPPSYLDLFGDVHSDNTRPIFVIGTERMPTSTSVCRHCVGKSCNSRPPRGRRISTEETNISTLPAPSSDTLQPDSDQPKSDNTRAATFSVDMDDVKDVEDVEDVGDLEGASANTVGKTITHEHDDRCQGSVPSDVNMTPALTANNQSTSAPSSSNHLSSSSTTNPALVNPSSCSCSCHQHLSILQFDNPGFSNDESQVSSVHPHGMPGMHRQPLPDMHRNFSNLSVLSTTTLTELPSYEEALEIIKQKEVEVDK